MLSAYFRFLDLLEIPADIALRADGVDALQDVRVLPTNPTKQPATDAPYEARPHFEIIDSKELGQRLGLPESWVREHVRQRAQEPIPHLRFGKYVRFRWNSPELEAGWRGVSSVRTTGLSDGSGRKEDYEQDS